MRLCWFVLCATVLGYRVSFVLDGEGVCGICSCDDGVAGAFYLRPRRATERARRHIVT